MTKIHSLDEGTCQGGITTTQVNNGSKAVRLTSANLTSTSGYARLEVHTYSVIPTVTLGTSSSVSFAWRAEGGQDAYDVYAYLVDIDDPSKKIDIT